MDLISRLLVLLLIFTRAGLYADNNQCDSIKINDNNMFIVTASIEGSNAIFQVPALIDTGASHSFIPLSIAEKIGFEHSESVKFLTAAGSKTFKTIKIKKISFLGAEIENIKVAIIELEHSVDNQTNNTKNKSEIAVKITEIAVIGMSELSKTRFYYENKKLTVCSNK